MGRRGERDRAVGAREALQLHLRRPQQHLILRVVDQVGERPALDVGVHPGLDRGEARGANLGRDLNVGHARLCEQGPELSQITEHERRAQPGRDLLPEQPLQQRGHLGVAGRGLEPVPDRDREPTARPQHPQHLLECALAVVEEHQPELADHGIELAHAVRQGLGQPFAPGDLGRLPPGDGEHALVAVEARDLAGRSGPPCRLARQHAGAAGDVQDLMARAECPPRPRPAAPIPGRAPERRIPHRPRPRYG